MPSIGAIIAVIVVVTWVVRIVASAAGNDQGNRGSGKQGRSLQEWERIQAQRRGEYTQSQPMQAPPQQKTRVDASQMTMAQRIELARQRAAGQQQGIEDSAEALQRARARAEAEARRRRQMQAQQQQQAQREVAQREQAERQRAEMERRRRAEARRKAEKRAEAERAELEKMRRRSRSGRKRKSKSGAVPTPKKDPSHVREDSLKRIHKGHGHSGKAIASARRRRKGVDIGPLDSAALRKAFILKELLDKPIALRAAQEDLLA